MADTIRVTVPAPSPAQSLKWNPDGIKILKGAGIAISGSLLTYFATLIPTLDLGKYTLLIAPLLMILINAGLKWYQGQPKQ